MAPVLIARPSTAFSTPQPIPDPPAPIPPQPPVQIPVTLEQTTSQILLPDPPPVQIPVTLEQTTSQILLQDPPPVQLLLPDPPPMQIPDPLVVETLEPSLTDDSSMDQIMVSVFGDYSPQEIPLAHTQEPQVLDTVPSLFDESNDLISFLDHFETGLAIEQQETSMDLTMPRVKKKVKKTTGFKVI
ncbi:hypothetical protein TNCV_1648591 [Trichonephila clavipes]|uniref:Uncharacterized protein n=1 Tax=Trichonephila clavipes TaxID=2585209 RepID=A0A8X6V8C4_TRICX|nr:hypothetical protein TNCV_1648591 [Trichonephila clavipes]